MLALPAIDVTLTDHEGITALQCARVVGYVAVASALAAADACLGVDSDDCNASVLRRCQQLNDEPTWRQVYVRGGLDK